MANGNTTPIRFGSDSTLAGSATPYDLFLKIFSGEVLTAFEGTTVMKDLHMVRTITSGKSAQFPVTGTATAKFHTPGENIADAGNSYLSDFKFSEKIINIDGMMLSAAFTPNVDDLMNHYDARSIISTELGRSLAYAFDKQVTYNLFAAARSQANILGSASSAGVSLGGGNVVEAAAKTNAQALINAIFDAVEILDTKDIPATDRYVLLRPAEYYLLINDPNNANILVNRDFADASNGGVVSGRVYEVAGCKIVKSNFVPVGINLKDTNAGAGGDQTDPFFGNAAIRNDVFGANGVGYAGIFTNTVAAVFHKAAVGTVKLLDLAMESEYQIERQGTLMVAKMMCGTAPLRPECAVEIKTA